MNNYKSLAFHLDGSPLDNDVLDLVTKSIKRAVRQVKRKGLHVTRLNVAEELEIDRNRLTRMINKLEIIDLFE